MFSTPKQFPRADEGPFLHEERQLLENIATIVSNYLNSQLAEGRQEEIEEETALRLEQSRILGEEKNIHDTLTQICRNMPRSWHYPEYAVARIVYGGREYLSSEKNFEDINGA